MKKLLILFCLLSFVLLCSAQTKETKSLLIKKTNDFYAWYKKNHTKLEKFHLYKGKGDNNGPPYRINWPAVEKYFAYIRVNTPVLGEAFITWHRNDFKRIDKWFKENPEEELPAGFDYERIVGGQVGVEEAVEYYFRKEGKWSVEINGNTATVAWVFNTKDYETGGMVETKSVTELKKEKAVGKSPKPLA
jgi:hypothetical protein